MATTRDEVRAGTTPPAEGVDGDAEEFRSLLAAERERLSALLPETDALGEEGAEELSSLDQHPAELGTETFDRERAYSLREQLVAELAAIDEAEQRLDDGSYGLCEACGRPIGKERLRVMPAARFCLDDQQAAEAEAAGRMP
jgi:RNA polymerase-binding transcription factor DksA